MTIGIIGCGTMGAGIAQVAASKGCLVHVYDTNAETLQKAQLALETTLTKLAEKGKITEDSKLQTLAHITWSKNIETLKPCELIIEAIVEKLEVKQLVFKQLETIVGDECILASNTSSLSITSIAASCKLPHRVIGIHFFNPAPLMQLVEIVPALQTQQTIVNLAQDIIASWSKHPVIAKDTPGFIVNRIARPYYSEAIRMYEEGIAGIAEIDTALKLYGGFKMGPFELMDLIGHDVNYTVTETVWTSFFYDPRYTPSFTQKRLVEAQWLGKKTGRGFYDYSVAQESVPIEESKAKSIVERVVVMLINEAAHALHMQVASKEDIEVAMTKGVNYPKGLLQWADEWGIAHCVRLLDSLYEEYHEDRYRCSPLLRKMKQTTFF